MPRPSNTTQRRSQIAAGLMQVMAQRGYDGSSVAEIARAAGLTQGLVHYHFKNKQEILLVALDNLVTEHQASLADRVQLAAGDPLAQVDAYIDFHLGIGADANPEALACWILISGEALRQPPVCEQYERAISGLAVQLGEVVQLGVDCGSFCCSDIPATSSAIVALIQGYFVLAATAKSAIPRGSAAKCAKQMAAGLLGVCRQAPDENRPAGGST